MRLEACPFELVHTQNDNLNRYFSSVNAVLGWSYGMWLPHCHIVSVVAVSWVLEVS